jgi:signal transduction histidine kinase
MGFELRTLLNGFSGPIQLFKQRVEDPNMLDIFRLIDSSLSRLERLSVRSIIISEIGSESFALAKTSVNIVDIARYSILDLQTLSDLENIKLNIPEQPSSIYIEGNYDLLIQAFEILIETAISLSKENTQIDIEFVTENEKVTCTISSTTAKLPTELNFNNDEAGWSKEVSWDLLMAKKLLSLHDAQVKVVNNNSLNYFELIFRKDKT